MARISTLTPLFRSESYIATFLQNAPNQTLFGEIQMILDLNMPSEYELSAAKAFEHKFPDIVRLHINQQVDPIGVSLNRCMNSATGDYLAIWNVDDLRTNNSLSAQAYILNSDQEVQAVHGPYLSVNSFGSRQGTYINEEKTLPEELRRGMHLGPFFMFRKSIVDRIGPFDEQFKSGADYDFALRLALGGKIGFTNDDLGYYLNAGLGLSTRPNSLQAIERTVIELRYGVFDRIDISQIPLITPYTIPLIKNGDEWIELSTLFPELSEIIQSNLRLHKSRFNTLDLRTNLKRTSRVIFAKVPLFESLIRRLFKRN